MYSLPSQAPLLALTYLEYMDTLKLVREYKLLECNSCGCSFALLSGHVDLLRRSGRDFYCPSTWGHSMSYPTGESEADKLRKELAELKARPPKVIEREFEVIIEVEKEPKDIEEFYRNHEHLYKGSGLNRRCTVCGVFESVVKIITTPS